MFENGHLSEEELALYVDAYIAGDLNEIPADLISHAKNCDECANKILSIIEITENLSDEDKSSKDETPTNSKGFFFKKNYFLQMAASIIFIVGAGLIFLQIKQTKNNPIKQYSEVIDSTISSIDSSLVMPEKNIQNTAQSKKDSLKQFKEVKNDNLSNNQNLLAFAEDEQLEKLVERYSDSALRGNFSIKSKSIIEIKSNELLKLEWNNDDKELLILEFFDNKGNKLFESETSESLFATDQFKVKGLYYWKLINEDFDLVFCGKIIIK
ncbi:MAG: hypothetical protein JEY96_13770 [Bacteroidales bacterium]|nr:hypothetical protein [Bacteroidales bacterium]